MNVSKRDFLKLGAFGAAALTGGVISNSVKAAPAACSFAAFSEAMK